MQHNPALGKGLLALLTEQVAPVSSDELLLIRLIDLDAAEPSHYQPRKIFAEDKLQELATSIRSNGVLQPIIVVFDEHKAKYQIVAGERRWRAAKLAGLTQIPMIIKHFSPQERLKVALLENIQRAELSAIEEAEGFERLITEFKYSQEQLSAMLGKSRSHIANLLRLNHLPSSIKAQVNQGKLSMGHARCLVNHQEAEIIAKYIIDHNLSVRRTESIVKNWSAPLPNSQVTNADQLNQSSSISQTKNNDWQLLAKALAKKLQIKVTIKSSPAGGKLILHYDNLAMLSTILSRLN